MSAGGKADSDKDQSAGPDDRPDAQRSVRNRQANNVVPPYLVEVQKVSSSNVS